MSIVNCFEESFFFTRISCFLATLLLAITVVAESISMYTTNGTDGVSGYVQADDVEGGDGTGIFGGQSITVKCLLPTEDLNHFSRKGYIRMDVSDKDFTAKTAYLDLMVKLTDSYYSGIPQTVKIYGLTDETLDNWSTNTTTWATAPGNDINSTYEVDASKTVYLGSVSVTYSTVNGYVRRLGTQNLVDFLNADTNGKVTFILCRTGDFYGRYNLDFAGDTHPTFIPPKLTISTDITSLTGTDGADGRVVAPSSANFNYGSIDIKNNNNLADKYVRKGYMRMDISSIDHECAAIDLTLSAVADYSGNNQIIKIYGLTDESLDDWDPATTTWTNAPGNDTSSTYAGDTNTVYLGQITVPYNAAVGDRFRFSSLELLNFLNADTNGKATFILGRPYSTGSGENLIFAGGLSGGYYDPPILKEFTTLSGTVQVGGDSGFFPVSGWHVKNAGITSDVTRKGYVRFDISGVDYTIGTAQLDLMLSLIDPSDYSGNDQIIKVYGLTDQSLDNWDPSTTTWSTAPANDTTSAYAPDLTKAVYLGDITVTPDDEAGDVKTLSNHNLVTFLNSDTNNLVTLIFGRYTGHSDGGGQNLLFAGEASATYAAPSLTFERANGTLVLIQ